MTFKQYIIDYSYNRGLSMTDCSEVAKRVMASSPYEAMAGRWDEPIDSYPPIVKLAIELSIDHHAIAYIDSGMARDWFRSMFEYEVTAK